MYAHHTYVYIYLHLYTLHHEQLDKMNKPINKPIDMSIYRLSIDREAIGVWPAAFVASEAINLFVAQPVGKWNLTISNK